MVIKCDNDPGLLKRPRSLLISENCAIKRKNATERMLEDPQPKLRSVCAKFAQERGKRFFLCLYSHNYFEQEIKNAVFFAQFTYFSRSYVLVRT